MNVVIVCWITISINYCIAFFISENGRTCIFIAFIFLVSFVSCFLNRFRFKSLLFSRLAILFWSINRRIIVIWRKCNTCGVNIYLPCFTLPRFCISVWVAISPIRVFFLLIFRFATFLSSNASNLLIHFWIVDFICLLDSRSLDCFVSPADFLAMSEWFVLWFAPQWQRMKARILARFVL